MIGYVMVGTNDLQKAEAFYNEVLAVLNIPQVRKTERMIFWSNGKGAAFAVTQPYDGKPATRGNGTMIAFPVSAPPVVDRIHRVALSLGGTDAGEPGPREGQMYSAYFRDTDGNKFLVFSPLQTN